MSDPATAPHARGDGPKGRLALLHDAPALLLTLTALFWAGNAIAGQLARDQIQPFTLVLIRWLAVAAILWPLYGHEVRAYWHVARPKLLRIVLMATLGFTCFNALFYVASLSTTAVNIGILQGSMPVFVLIGCALAFGDRVRPVQAAGVALTLVGVVLVATGGDLAAMIESGINPGDGVMLAACVLYSFYTLALRGRPDMPGRAFFTLMCMIAAVAAIPFAAGEALVTGGQWPTLEGWAVAAYVAVFPSCLAQLFFLRGVDLIGPGRAGVYINLVPVFAAILAVVLLGQPFFTHHAVALVLVLGGIWLAQRPG
ncbi:MAG: DMT family transporter [Pseudomonadota bacterium]